MAAAPAASLAGFPSTRPRSSDGCSATAEAVRDSGSSAMSSPDSIEEHNIAVLARAWRQLREDFAVAVLLDQVVTGLQRQVAARETGRFDAEAVTAVDLGLDQLEHRARDLAPALVASWPTSGDSFRRWLFAACVAESIARLRATPEVKALLRDAAQAGWDREPEL